VASILEYDNFLGRVLTGRVEQGMAKINMPVKVLRRDGSVVETGRLTKLLSFRGLERVPVDEVMAGDIIAVAGLSDGTIPDTIGAPGKQEIRFQKVEVNPPEDRARFEKPTADLTPGYLRHGVFTIHHLFLRPVVINVALEAA